MGFSAAASRAENPQGNETDVTQTDVDFLGEASPQVRVTIRLEASPEGLSAEERVSHPPDINEEDGCCCRGCLWPRFFVPRLEILEGSGILRMDGA